MKPHIFHRGKFWWCKGIFPKTSRSIVVHGTSAVNAWWKFILMCGGPT